jgi:F0F1-type ATP synthase assembly protein I
MAKEPPRNELSWYRLMGVGFEFIVSVLVCGVIGWRLDVWLRTEPWLMLLGGAVGFAAGLWMLIRTALGSFRD